MTKGKERRKQHEGSHEMFTKPIIEQVAEYQRRLGTKINDGNSTLEVELLVSPLEKESKPTPKVVFTNTLFDSVLTAAFTWWREWTTNESGLEQVTTPSRAKQLRVVNETWENRTLTCHPLETERETKLNTELKVAEPSARKECKQLSWGDLSFLSLFSLSPKAQ